MSVIGSAQDRLERLADFCRIPTISTNQQALEQATVWLTSAYGRYAHIVDVMRADDGAAIALCLVFEASGGDRRPDILFYNYYDVTSPGKEGSWQVPPFGAVIRDGRLYARGAAANKADLIARLDAVARLAATGRLGRRVAFVLDAQEELGAKNVPAMLSHWRAELSCSLCVWNTGWVGSGGAPFVSMGFKGVVLARLAVRAAASGGHSGIGLGVSALDRLMQGIMPLLESDGQRLLGGSGDASPVYDPEPLRAGRMFDALVGQAHAGALGEPWTSKSTVELLEQILFRPSTNLAWMSGGSETEPTRYADSAECLFELRLLPGQSATTAAKALADWCAQRGIVCTPQMRLEPYAVAVSDYAGILADVGPAFQRTFEVPPVVLPVAPSSAPAVIVSEALASPVIGIGVSDEQSNPHGVDESVSCATFERCARMVEVLCARRPMDSSGGEGHLTRPGVRSVERVLPNVAGETVASGADMASRK